MADKFEPLSDEELDLVKGMPHSVAVGFLVEKREAAKKTAHEQKVADAIVNLSEALHED